MSNDSPVNDRDGLIGEATVVREVYDQAPVMIAGTAGPEHLVVAVNAAFRAGPGRSDLVGMKLTEAYPEAVRQGILPVYDRVFATGVAETKKAWRAQLETDAGLVEFFLDFTAAPRFAADGTVAGLTVHAIDVTEQVMEKRAAEERAARAEARFEQARSTPAELQEALLPAGLPLLPGLDLAARYVPAERDTAAGGDWYDTVPLPDGRIALVVGDVVGHGVRASAVMGRLRTVVQERLRAGCTAVEALRAASVHAGRIPGGRAATCCIAVVDLADGRTVDATSADVPAKQIPLSSHAGTFPLTLDLTGVTHLASAGVQTLHAAAADAARHGQRLRLIAPEDSVAAEVLTLAALPFGAPGSDAL
ncbi:SpoIIE family protein phosphatase [Streptomyces populi]